MNDSETLDGVTDMDSGNTDNMANGGGSDPQAMAESMGESMGDTGDDWVTGDEAPGDADNSSSAVSALRSTEPHEDLDDVSRLKLSPDYWDAYATRGTNKALGTAETEAWQDFVLAAVCYGILLMKGDTTESDESEAETGAHPELDGPDVVGP